MYDLSCGFSQINNFYALFKNCDHSFWRMTCWNTLHILPYSMFENPKFLYKVARKFLVFVWRIKCGKICSDSTGVIPPSINLFFLKKCLWWHFQKSHRPKKIHLFQKFWLKKLLRLRLRDDGYNISHQVKTFFGDLLYFFKSYA